MTCERSSSELLSAYIDGELDDTRRRDVAAHVASCPDCSRTFEEMNRLRASIAGSARAHAPAELTERIRSLLRQEDAADAPPRRAPVRAPLWQLAAAAAFLALMAGWGGWIAGDRMARVDQIAHDVVTAHMRSLAQGMPMQVASNDQHNVKPWFAGRIDYSPQVKDLASAGFELAGGRLDYVAGRRVGVIVYKRRLHWIDVYAWPADTAAPEPRSESLTGYNIVSWTRGGITYWAVSDLNRAELQEFSRLL